MVQCGAMPPALSEHESPEAEKAGRALPTPVKWPALAEAVADDAAWLARPELPFVLAVGGASGAIYAE